MRNVTWVLITAACLTCACPSFAAPAPVLSLSLVGNMIVPTFDSASWFSAPGTGGSIDADVTLPGILPLFLAPSLSLGGAVLNPSAEKSLVTSPPYFLSLTTGMVARFPLAPWIDLSCDARAGYYHAFVNAAGSTVNGGGLALDAGAGVDFNIGDWVTLSVDGRYTWEVGLVQDFTLAVGAGTHIPLGKSGFTRTAPTQAQKPQQKPEPQKPQAQKPEPLKAEPQAQESSEWLAVQTLAFDSLYPVFYKHYARLGSRKRGREEHAHEEDRECHREPLDQQVHGRPDADPRPRVARAGGGAEDRAHGALQRQGARDHRGDARGGRAHAPVHARREELPAEDGGCRLHLRQERHLLGR